MERQKISELYSYDKDFDRIKDSEIARLEPLPTPSMRYKKQAVYHGLEQL